MEPRRAAKPRRARRTEPVGGDGQQPESSRVTAWIRDEILDGVRMPGSKLVERDLAAEFGVSRVPVREALQVLDKEGLVTLRPRTWAIVREFSYEDMVEMDEVRSVIEVLAFRLAAQRCDREGLQRLRDTLDAERAGGLAGDPVAARRAAADFHEVVTELADNRMLDEVAGTMRSRMRWLYSQHDDFEHMSEEHEALFEAIAHRDLAGIDRLVRTHLTNSHRLRETHRSAMTTKGLR